MNVAARALTGEALVDASPLVALIERHVDARLVQRVAAAHAAGRRLYIGTVDLDSLRFVVWNMGLIAASGRPRPLALFRQVMLASASIPIAFPPVFFDVTVNDRAYDEMHVDGAVGARVFYSEGLFRPPLSASAATATPTGAARTSSSSTTASCSRRRRRRAARSRASRCACSTPPDAPG